MYFHDSVGFFSSPLSCIHCRDELHFAFPLAYGKTFRWLPSLGNCKYSWCRHSHSGFCVDTNFQLIWIHTKEHNCRITWQEWLLVSSDRISLLKPCVYVLHAQRTCVRCLKTHLISSALASEKCVFAPRGGRASHFPSHDPNPPFLLQPADKPWGFSLLSVFMALSCQLLANGNRGEVSP